MADGSAQKPKTFIELDDEGNRVLQVDTLIEDAHANVLKLMKEHLGILNENSFVQLVMASSEEFTGEADPPTADPDQPELEHDDDGVVFDNTAAGAAPN